ncbi:hypothetical protein BDP27DRAFT_1425626 [Rhodocollybia butyracea]|uniref:Uncharacterized protein n=1 Tax=Rhodocollybia butyracea TaxID=206335 RepID=A0A9P5PMI0_9AGAR|nr:hypothetical protein BDP27DRAFT_1425626 [Rhodocollybia butyracea]
MTIFLFIFAFNIGLIRQENLLGGAFSSSITALTLFEFGTNCLIPGSTTLPLSPLGTANGNSETTYLYEIIGSVEGQNFVGTASRTLVVLPPDGWSLAQLLPLDSQWTKWFPKLTVTPVLVLSITPELNVTPELTVIPELTITPELIVTPELTVTSSGSNRW